jgi:hypothetical protein
MAQVEISTLRIRASDKVAFMPFQLAQINLFLPGSVANFKALIFVTGGFIVTRGKHHVKWLSFSAFKKSEDMPGWNAF